MPMRPPPPGFEEIQRAEYTRAFKGVVGKRMLVAPIASTIMLAVIAYEPAVWRRAVLGSGIIAILTVSVIELIRFRRQGLTENSFAVNVGLGVFGQLLVSFATGALESPVMPAIILLGIINGLFIRSRAARAVLSGFQFCVVWLFAFLELGAVIPTLNPEMFGGGPRSGHDDFHLIMAALVYSIAAVIAAGVGRTLRRIFETMVRRALEAREESLKAHADRAKELMGLSGEIAHELKNPLASVKGLAALLAQNVASDAKGAQRLSVLRHEIDRMQGILEEFLNFSRPLVPLALERGNLFALSQDVVQLHEGVARERGVEIELSGAPVAVSCDPRKVKQILINVVQNAIEATPAGGRVRVLVEGGPAGQGMVQVIDSGSGIDQAVGERIFEPGVTTKAKGSGLGLTIARALARQHGGELTLRNGERGGCVAELVLPVESEVASTAAQLQQSGEEAGRGMR